MLLNQTVAIETIDEVLIVVRDYDLHGIFRALFSLRGFFCWLCTPRTQSGCPG
jgi:hypothetical protein